VNKVFKIPQRRAETVSGTILFGALRKVHY